MPKMSASQFADEAAESIIKGNMSDVIEQLDALPKKAGSGSRGAHLPSGSD